LFNSFDVFDLVKKQISLLHQALYKIKSYLQIQNQNEKKQKSGLTFPWWCLFIASSLCIILVGVSIFFIIVRGIEFDDLKTQQWLTSILSGFINDKSNRLIGCSSCRMLTKQNSEFCRLIFVFPLNSAGVYRILTEFFRDF
jgi:hypothetical protein